MMMMMMPRGTVEAAWKSRVPPEVFGGLEDHHINLNPPPPHGGRVVNNAKRENVSRCSVTRFVFEEHTTAIAHQRVHPSPVTYIQKEKGSCGAMAPSVADHRDEFINLIAEQTSKAEAAAAARTEEAARDVIGAKQMNADNGLQTSCFTVCTRVRPAFEAELAEGGDNFSCLLACGPKTAGTETTEAAVVLLPTVSMRGAPKLEKKAFAFDHTFGPASTDDGIFERIGMPLVARAKAGQVACIFAYGQTGSGKTHTIGNLLDRVVNQLFVKEDGPHRRHLGEVHVELIRLNSTFDFSDPLSFDSLRVWAILFVSGVTRDYIRRKNFPGRLKSRPLDA